MEIAKFIRTTEHKWWILVIITCVLSLIGVFYVLPAPVTDQQQRYLFCSVRKLNTYTAAWCPDKKQVLLNPSTEIEHITSEELGNLVRFKRICIFENTIRPGCYNDDAAVRLPLSRRLDVFISRDMNNCTWGKTEHFDCRDLTGIIDLVLGN